MCRMCFQSRGLLSTWKGRIWSHVMDEYGYFACYLGISLRIAIPVAITHCCSMIDRFNVGLLVRLPIEMSLDIPPHQSD